MPELPRSISIVIATRNRSECVGRAIGSALEQVSVADVVVIDDASSDGTAEMVASRFPQARLHRFEQNVGLLRARNQGVAMARGDAVLFLDDDAYFTHPETAAHLLADFDHPRIAVVAGPYEEHGRRLQIPPDHAQRYLSARFRELISAVRRDVFLALGGFNEALWFYNEASDLAIRMLAAGCVVRLGRAAPTVHDPYPERDLRRRITLRWRNELTFKYRFTPLRWLPAALGAHLAHTLNRAVRDRQLGCWAGATGGALAAVLSGGVGRRPIPPKVYGVWRRLRSGAPIRLEDVEPDLPPVTLDLDAEQPNAAEHHAAASEGSEECAR